jgi:DNA-binding SARP family transcriptional activator/predicted transcriptional regulator
VLPKVYLLGEPRVVVGKKDYRFVANRRSQLLAYLAYKHERVTRDQLADVFWSHTDSQAARRNLRKVLFEAKNLEWSSGFEQDEQGASWLIDTDVAGFEAAVKQKDWAKAIELYTGPFLKGLESEDGAEFETWLEQERQRLEELYQSASEHYADALEKQGHIDEALIFLRKTLEHDPLNESLHRHIIRLEYDHGNSEAAFEQFERCREVLQKELGVEPLEETIALLKKLEQGTETQGKFAHLLRKSEAVPEAPQTLFGRDKLLNEILALIKKGERVLAQGFGGMGKTALAATVAKTILQQNKKPLLWLQVGTENPDAVFEALARPFDAHQDLAQAEDKAAYLKNVLQKQSLSLLVLDDVWNAYTLSKVMEALPKGLAFLVTSRQRYPRLSRVYVDRLERSASIDLLKHYSLPPLIGEVSRSDGGVLVRKVGRTANENPPALSGIPPVRGDKDEGDNRLCDLLGDHAFAIRLAGLALRETTIEELYERIKNAPHDLKIPGELKEVGRESVASLLNVSLETLDDRAYETFLSYGILESPSASAGFLSQCLDREVSQIEDALFNLVQRGLAERVSKPGSDLVSYRLHDLAHSYAKANRFQRLSTLRQSAMSFLKNHKDAVDVLDLDISNILAATQIAKEQNREDELVEFMYLLTVEGSYYMARGHNRRSVEMLELGIQKAKQEGMTEKAHYLLGKLGNYYQNYLGKFDNALTVYQHALLFARELEDKGREALLLGVMGQVKAQQQKLEEAAKYAEQAYQLAKENGDDYVLSDVLGQVSYVAGLRGEGQRANQLFRESLNLLDKLEKSGRIAPTDVVQDRFYLLLNLGESEYQLNNIDEGFSLRKQALEIAKSEANQLWMALAYQVIGEMHHSVGHPELARENIQEALQLFEANNAFKEVEAVRHFLQLAGYIDNLSAR